MSGQKLLVDQLAQMRGEPVWSSEGEKIGSIEEIFYDDQSGVAEWIGIGTGFFGTKRVLVPIEGATLRDGGVTVPYAKDRVKDSPDIDGDAIDEDTEAGLHAHYALSSSGPHSDSSRSAGESDESKSRSVTRSEEELRVGKREVEAGSVRLRKWVETVPVQADVDLKRETVQVTREAIDEPVSGAEIGEEEIEIPLHREEAVVQKQTVGKERITLQKDVEINTEQVSDEIRKERVEVDDNQKS